MTGEEFQKITDLIKSNFKVTFLDNADSADILFNYCNQFAFATCRSAIIDLIEHGEYDPLSGYKLPVTIDLIERKIERYARIEKEKKTEQKISEKVCPVCKGNGFLLRTYPTGVEYMRPCNCPKGRESYPLYFMSDESYQELYEREKKEGKHPPKRRWGSSLTAEEERIAKYGK